MQPHQYNARPKPKPNTVIFCKLFSCKQHRKPQTQTAQIAQTTNSNRQSIPASTITRPASTITRPASTFTRPGSIGVVPNSPTFSLRRKPIAKSGNQPQILYLTPPYVNNMLVKGSFKTIVPLPKYVDPNEWLAYNVFEFFNYTTLFYGSISDFCTPQNCPTMYSGPSVEYTWIDAARKSTKLNAPQYVDYMTTWIQNLLTDENVFPTKAGLNFPPDFLSTIKSIFRQLIRLFVHIYHYHYTQVLCLNEEAHLNSLFAHFIAFSREFDLLDKKDVAPLQGLINIMEANNVFAA